MIQFKVTLGRPAASDPLQAPPPQAPGLRAPPPQAPAATGEAPAPGPWPIRRGGPGTALGALIALAACAACLWPPALRSLGLGGWADTLAQFGTLRFFFAAPMLLYFLGSVRSLVRPSPAAASAEAWTQFAAAVGGTLSARSRTLTADGWEGGARVECRIDPFVAVLDVISRERLPRTRMRVAVETRSAFLFLLTRESAGMKLVTSKAFMRGVTALARASAGGGERGEQARAALSQISLLESGDVTLGTPEFDRAYILLASDPDAGRALFSDGGVRQALERLQPLPAGAQFSLTGESNGTGLLEYHEPGTIADAQRLEAVHALVSATLRHLAEHDLTRERTARTG